MWWMWGAGGIVMMLGMLLFWAAVIAAIVVGVRWLTREGREPRADSAMGILRERYARGDISREEFEQRRNDLGR
ncbi:MAG: SHOCT domain-containing protein [Candidatus Rokubacteria bacterium]|nr:SHOCT domain-containing protein [Candidatus Rokubacteria bacterium]